MASVVQADSAARPAGLRVSVIHGLCRSERHTAVTSPTRVVAQERNRRSRHALSILFHQQTAGRCGARSSSAGAFGNTKLASERRAAQWVDGKGNSTA